jgi:hypothetical protein
MTYQLLDTINFTRSKICLSKDVTQRQHMFYVMYHYETNAMIFVTPIASLDFQSILEAYKTNFEFLVNKGYTPKINIMDNQTTKSNKKPTFPCSNVASSSSNPAEILGDPYSKKSPLPSIGNFPCLANSPKLSSYQVLGQSRIQQRHITCYNHPRIEAQ